MPLRLEISRKLSATSERVKCCDIHPTEPWIASALFSGHVFIWNYQTQALVKTIEVSELPIRAAKFVPRKQWIITGSDVSGEEGIESVWELGRGRHVLSARKR